MGEQATDLMMVFGALKFAAERHRNQTRKDDKTPYINHPIEVAEILARVGKVTDGRVLAAALLHDTIEDTGTQPEEISTRFGDEVLKMVLDCTDDKSLPKQERKRLAVETAPHKCNGAKLIKLADKISNMRDVVEQPPPSWSWERRSEYIEWANSLFHAAKGINSDLDRFFETVYERCRKALDTVREHQTL